MDYRTFTIRHKRFNSDLETEYQKRMRAIYGEGGFLYPHFTIQAYIDLNKLSILSIGIILTKLLYDYIQRYPNEIIYREVKKNGAAIFMVAKWILINQKMDINMDIIEGENKKHENYLLWD